MAKIDSPNWTEHGCEKHRLPEVPCPQCFAEEDADIEVQITETEVRELDFSPELSVRDLLPLGWLADRIIG
ncbi:MAG: hypothetical protein COU47_00600 [Candidatus Niyogibacteria bacterium CG10_big_fil_rev_8_21_14_0_10_46_36]|uniref:Uncharacterized protein n=1 Tax=Candidatus Niyogibacteria bacterium CG10_big_fil_rev_8_21_14_0_10_46_36 TaxID=1974726 RepID=A0A2H0TED9_9BACT|nr:MAG: hypothetical protein COU47_00600 [Candidatus Niyogibacteria bacterium CG10_big_fil_rev_8_21_14_0_10_46_36]